MSDMDEIVSGAPLGPRVKRIEPTDNFELLLTFNNGERKKFDAKELFQYPMYELLKDIEFFKGVKVEYGTAVWNDDVDICPDTLYEMSVPVDYTKWQQDLFDGMSVQDLSTAAMGVIQE